MCKNIYKLENRGLQNAMEFVVYKISAVSHLETIV
jgi:hypothetical protein